MRTINKLPKQAFVIISAFQVGLDEFANMDKLVKLGQELRDNGLEFKQVTGFYKGNAEQSFVVLLHHDLDYGTVINLSAVYNQESVLYVDEQRNAKLVFRAGPSQDVDLGKFVCVDKYKAEAQDNYTQDGNDYYVCEKEVTEVA